MQKQWLPVVTGTAIAALLAAGVAFATNTPTNTPTTTTTEASTTQPTIALTQEQVTMLVTEVDRLDDEIDMLVTEVGYPEIQTSAQVTATGSLEQKLDRLITLMEDQQRQMGLLLTFLMNQSGAPAQAGKSSGPAPSQAPGKTASPAPSQAPGKPGPAPAQAPSQAPTTSTSGPRSMDPASGRCLDTNEFLSMAETLDVGPLINELDKRWDTSGGKIGQQKRDGGLRIANPGPAGVSAFWTNTANVPIKTLDGQPVDRVVFKVNTEGSHGTYLTYGPIELPSAGRSARLCQPISDLMAEFPYAEPVYPDGKTHE